MLNGRPLSLLVFRLAFESQLLAVGGNQIVGIDGENHELINHGVFVNLCGSVGHGKGIVDSAHHFAAVAAAGCCAPSGLFSAFVIRLQNTIIFQDFIHHIIELVIQGHAEG